MPGDSVDIFQTSIVDRYAARPKTLEHMCCADFASQYVTGSNTEQDNNLDDAVKLINNKRQSITLQNKLGKMYHLKTPYFIRFHATPRRKDPENYSHRILMMYLPWRDHEELKFEGSYEKKLLMVSSQLVEKIEEYEGRLPELMDISVSEENISQHAWDSLAPQTEQEKDDEAIIIPEHFDPSENPPEFDVTGSLKQNQPFSVEYSNIYIPSSQYNSMVQTLNERQRLVHDFIVDWCWKVKIKQNPQPFHLGGGGGVGKSHTLTTVYHGIIDTLRKAGQDPSQISVLLTAPTGTAAFNIGGMTTHSALSRPIKESQMHNQHEYIPLSTEKKISLKCKLHYLKVLIIDEISMVGSQTLINIHKRLKEIKAEQSEDIPFGGVSILAVGDLLQLQPVGDSPVFASPKNAMHGLSMSLWGKHFQYIEVNEVQRQRGDPLFADILNRVRLGNQTTEDISVLSSRITQQPLDCLHIFPTNQQVHDFNEQKLLQISDTATIAIHSHDQLSVQGKRKLHIPENRHLTGGLNSVLRLAVGARVSIVKNLMD